MEWGRACLPCLPCLSADTAAVRGEENCLSVRLSYQADPIYAAKQFLILRSFKSFRQYLGATQRRQTALHLQHISALFLHTFAKIDGNLHAFNAFVFIF
jgi:hypothetical protein